MNPNIVTILKVAVYHSGIEISVVISYTRIAANTIFSFDMSIDCTFDVIYYRIFKLLLNICTMISVITDLREVIIFFFGYISFMIISGSNYIVFDPEFDLVHLHDFTFPEFHLLGTEMIIRSFGTTFCLRSIVSHNMIRVKLKFLGTDIIFSGFTASCSHCAGFSSIVVDSPITIKCNTRSIRHQLQNMSPAGDANDLLFDIAIDFIALKAMPINLKDINFSYCLKLTGFNIITQIVAFKYSRCRRGFLFLLLLIICLRYIIFRRLYRFFLFSLLFYFRFIIFRGCLRRFLFFLFRFF